MLVWTAEDVIAVAALAIRDTDPSTPPGCRPLASQIKPALTYGECKREVDLAMAMLTGAIDRLSALAARIETEWRPPHMPKDDAVKER